MDDLILLEGCGQLTQWKFPAELKMCPVKKCGLQFTVRMDAITHYKNLHAKDSVLCSICDVPIYAERLKDFEKHYHALHPDVDFKLKFDGNTTQVVCNLVNDAYSVIFVDNICNLFHLALQINGADDEDVEEESKDVDLLTLSGCGYITKWRFPQDLKNCPVLRCRKLDFPSRSDAIAHYKLKHAKDAILCHPCNKPISAPHRQGFKLHNDSMHPNIKDPFSGLTKINETKNDGSDDTVILHGCGQFTEYRFPKTKRCPVIKCSLSFDTRSAALNHYKNIHAQNAIFCYLCNKPVGIRTFKALILHYRKKHPGRKVPFSIKEQRALESPSQTNEVIIFT